MREVLSRFCHGPAEDVGLRNACVAAIAGGYEQARLAMLLAGLGNSSRNFIRIKFPGLGGFARENQPVTSEVAGSSSVVPATPSTGRDVGVNTHSDPWRDGMLGGRFSNDESSRRYPSR